MPSGAKKRKAAKKKKANDSSTLNPLQVVAEGNDGGQLGSPAPTMENPSVEIVKREDCSAEKISKDANEEEGSVVIETVSKSKSSSSSSSSDSSDDESRVVEKEVVVVESAPVESVPVVEPLTEEISTVVDPVKPVDSLVEVSHVSDVVKNEDKKDLVVEETPVVEEQPRVDDFETAVKDNCPDSTVVESVLEEVERVQPLVEKTSPELKDHVSSSTPPKDLVSDVNGANETVTSEHSDRQAPVAVQNTTSWKSCCGIFELFSGSGR